MTGRITSPEPAAFVVLTPPGPPEPGLAIAASRAGALGVLNLEFVSNTEEALLAVSRLALHAHNPFGILIDPCWDGFDAVLQRLPDNSTTVILSPNSGEAVRSRVEAVHRAAREAWVTAISMDQVDSAEKSGADALVVKGQEAGGWIGEETAFVLAQRAIPRTRLPVFVLGGIGLRTAAACFAAGAAGVVLDSQLLLTRESPVSGIARDLIESMDGSETVAAGASLGAPFRAYSRTGGTAAEELRKLEVESNPEAWRASVREKVDWSRPDALWAIGQDACFASELAARYGTTGGVLAALASSAGQGISAAREFRPLSENSALAQSHQTRYPIVQGPMTRVSDRPEFAAAVADAGGLPFMALALMRAPEIRPILAETSRLLGDRSWGVGILGFVPPELRKEQLEVISEARPPFALIAGGHPHQARVLESQGIATYLHAPSPGLLRMFTEEGIRRFVFEGRECGGHIGPRTSFVLWESMIETLTDFIDRNGDGDRFHVLFAGGIHDGLSAAMVSAMASPLAQRNVKIGVLVGTAYLFTNEAVETGAVSGTFQTAAIQCDRTVTLEATRGYATRCLPSPFCSTFEERKRELGNSGMRGEDLKQALEELNIGRLRIASKGVDRNPRFGQSVQEPRLVPVDAESQWKDGMYMIGQVAAIRDGRLSVAGLHAEIAAGAAERLEKIAPIVVREDPVPEQASVAIIGMSTILPGASNLRTFWDNILGKVDAVTEVPPGRWDTSQYFDADPNAKDKVYSRWGGFIDEVPFDPLYWGMPPSSLKSIEPFQLLALEIVRQALQDAGYSSRPFARDRTSVILGAGGGAPDLTEGYVVRSSLPKLLGGDAARGLIERLGDALPEWTEDSFPGLLMNVAAGRVANRFDFGGVNYTVDAACASSLAAVYLGVRDLEAGTSDVVIVGGVEAIQNPFDYFCFSKTKALSPGGRSRPFDENADGIAISEGFAAVVLKRLEDAERDGDRIYAVIRGAGGSSDGRDKGLTAPRPEGQMRALRRAYSQAGFSAASVGLFEAHGTGTVAGDRAEAESLGRVLLEAGASPRSSAVGSVKSMIGHTKATAGVAGLVKVALALHHRILPPTIGVERPNPRTFTRESPLYVNSEPRPWIRADGSPRRAGVSAFGFGGTNFHIALEEYQGEFLGLSDPVVESWPAELFVWRGPRDQIEAKVRTLLEELRAADGIELPALAKRLCQAAQKSPRGPALAIVAGTSDSLVERMNRAIEMLESETGREHSSEGVHWSANPLAETGKVAFIFPGQGSQYPNMALDLAMVFPDVRHAFDRADSAMSGRLERPLSSLIFPAPSFSPEEAQLNEQALTTTRTAQPALGATESAMLRLLTVLDVRPDMTAGHSFGELVALHCAGVISEKVLIELAQERGRLMSEAAAEGSGSMVAVMAPLAELGSLFAEYDVIPSNLNSPTQTVLSGPSADVDAALTWCDQHGVTARKLQVGSAFHSPLMSPVQKRFTSILSSVPMEAPVIPVYSNTTASMYPPEPSSMRAMLSEHLVRPVEFIREIEAMYEDGARIFVEVGPRRVLTGLVGQILLEREHLSVPLDEPGVDGVSALLNACAALFCEGVPIRLESLFSGRSAATEDPGFRPADTDHSPTTWLVGGGGVRPAGSRPQRPAPPLLPSPGRPRIADAPPRQSSDSFSAGTPGRFVLRCVPAANSSYEAGLEPSGTVVVVDDGAGVAVELCDLLEKRGHRTLLLQGGFTGPVPGKVSGLIDLRGLGNPGGIEGEVGSLIGLAKALRPGLLESAAGGGSLFLTAIRLDGQFGCSDPAAFDPVQAWRVGFAKSVAREWPTVRVKAVDVGLAPAGRAASLVFAEAFSGDDLVEAGYGHDDLRRTPRLLARPAPRSSEAPLNDQSVLLVTGGGRGITSECALAMATAYRPITVLVGRTAFPRGAESPETAGLIAEPEIKRALARLIQKEGTAATPVAIDSRYRQLMGSRALRGSLQRFASTGARIIYVSCDVTDRAAFGAVIDDIYNSFGRLDGVLHGAGVIEDGLVEGKSVESFLRVFGTKVDSALVLAEKLRAESLKFLVFFSSISGRFGNRGQSDYSAANEVLNKLARRLDAAWPSRVVAVNWGPWDSAGMVTEQALRQLDQLGVGLVGVAEGTRMLADEISMPHVSEPEVVAAVLGGEAKKFVLDHGFASGAAPTGDLGALPMLSSQTSSRRDKGGFEVVRALDPSYDLYLNDHVLDGKPVVPFAMAIDLVAEVAKAGWPQLDVLEVSDIRVFSGIVIHGGSDEIVVRAIPLPARNGRGRAGERLSVEVTVASARDSRKLHYRATVALGQPSGSPEAIDPGTLNGAGPLGWDIQRVYDEWLFHGPTFQAIESIEKMGPLGATGYLRPSSPAGVLGGIPRGRWLADPVLIDAAFQMQVVWVRKHWDMTILPSSVAAWRPGPAAPAAFGSDAAVRCELRIRPATRSPISHSDFAFFTTDGQLVGTIIDLQATGSKELNRLSVIAHSSGGSAGGR